MNRPVTKPIRSRIRSSRKQKPKASGVFVKTKLVQKGKRTHQEGSQKSYSHHQTRGPGDLRECSTLAFERVRDRVILARRLCGLRRGGCLRVGLGGGGCNGIESGVGPSSSGGSEGRAILIDTLGISGCIAAASSTTSATKGLARALYVCRVRAPWVKVQQRSAIQSGSMCSNHGITHQRWLYRFDREGSTQCLH